MQRKNLQKLSIFPQWGDQFIKIQFTRNEKNDIGAICYHESVNEIPDKAGELQNLYKESNMSTDKKEESRQTMKPEVKQDIDPIRADLLNNAQMAAILGIRVDTVTRKIKQGQIPKHNVVINQRLKFWSRDFIKGFLNLEVSK